MGKPFSLTKYKGVSIETFELEELIGDDSLDAFARIVAPGGAASNQTAMGVMHLNQLIAQSISKVNGELVVRPFTAWTKWNLRTQDFVTAAFTRYNGITKEEREGFLADSFGTPAEASSTPSSPSGPGSPGT
jgi:hypothetical protein